MTMSKMKLLGALSAMTVASVMSQSSCVQLNATDLSSCPCDDATLTFTLEGETSVEANTVNLAIILDGTFSLSPADIALEQDFAKDIVAAFDAKNLFENGGTASYAEYSILVAPGTHLFVSGTFESAADFNDFVDADGQSGGGTTSSIGIDEGRELLGVSPASASFMIVITGGQSESITAATAAAADAARAEGIVVLAVGAGDAIGNDDLLGIGGDAANVFLAEDFDVLDAALDSIFSSNGGTTVPCPSTGATVTIQFTIPVGSTSSGSISGNTVTFSAADLESNPTDFNVLLDVCGEIPGGSVVVSADYTDDQGNAPDLSNLTGLVVGNDLCASPTPSPTKMSVVPTPHPTTVSTVPTPHPTTMSVVPTPHPTMLSVEPTPTPSKMSPEPTPCPDDKKPEGHPKRGEQLNKCGSPTHSTYLGCYVDEAQNRALKGPMFSSPDMTPQMCAESCSSSGFEYFGTAYSSDCHCGDSQPKSREGVCNYECSGDNYMACGGVGTMSVYKSDN